MRLSAVVNCAAFVSMLSFAGAAGAATEPLRVSGPVTHENLSIYFIHGPSQKGPVPLTLEEALRDGKVQVRETGNVNSLEIENLDADGLSQLWGVLGSRYLPSVLYRMRTVTIDAGALTAETLVIRAPRAAARADA